MGKWKIELVESGVGEILKSDEMGQVTASIGESVINACGGIGSANSDEFVASTDIVKDRVSTRITADTPRAHYSNLKHNTLVKALGSVKSK